MPNFLRGFDKVVSDAIRRGVPREIRAAARSGLDHSSGIVSSAKPLMGRNLATGLATGGALANLASRSAVIPSLIDTAQSVFNPKDNIITALQNLGTSVGNQFAAPGQERRYVGSNPAAVAANRRLDARNVGDITGRYIPGSQQYPFISGSPSPVDSPSAETPAARRAYQGEKARVAQMTEQDPLFKKYKVAELTKAYNTATPEEKERIGLEIWATTNPKLASKVRPGQVGYQTSAAMSGTQVFGSEIPGITQASYQQAVEGANKIPFSGMAAPDMSAYGMGANAIQFGTTPPGTPPPSMIGENVFNKGFDVPSSKDLSQTQLALLKRAFEGRLK